MVEEKAIEFKMITSGIGQITLNNPSRRNALTSRMWGDFSEALSSAASEVNLKVLVITGAGEHFASGADISEFPTLYATPESSAEISQKIASATEALSRFPRPTIAKIRGACVGGGAAIALACDIRFADNTSMFAITPSKLGLVYPFSDVRRLVQVIGISNAKDLLFSARRISAEDAKDMGIVNELIDQQGLDQRVQDCALAINETSKNSAMITKKMFMAIAEGQGGETTLTRQWFLEAFTSEDFKEGYEAFLQKRKPNF